MGKKGCEGEGLNHLEQVWRGGNGDMDGKEPSLWGGEGQQGWRGVNKSVSRRLVAGVVL